MTLDAGEKQEEDPRKAVFDAAEELVKTFIRVYDLQETRLDLGRVSKLMRRSQPLGNVIASASYRDHTSDVFVSSTAFWNEFDEVLTIWTTRITESVTVQSYVNRDRIEELQERLRELLRPHREKHEGTLNPKGHDTIFLIYANHNYTVVEERESTIVIKDSAGTTREVCKDDDAIHWESILKFYSFTVEV